MPFVPKASFAWRAYRRLVRTQVEYFSAPDPFPAVDVLKLCNLPAPFPGVVNGTCPTVVVDLGQPEEALWNGVESKTRKVIRQAVRDGVQVGIVPELTAEKWSAFRAAYGELRSRRKNADPLGVGQIGELMEKGIFVMTTSHDTNGNVLSWHSYVRCHGRARLLNTVSAIDPERGTHWNNLVGRAHRLHHWNDMLLFKGQGVGLYDLGGVYRGTVDQQQINIANFKLSFGGKQAETYDSVLPLTDWGRIALSLVARIGAEARSG
ncbi:MAG: hypothetical protein KGJ49_13625 [Alphaproteobacteria bacterium]|nr:hypothetical protein [Alphaproteobacteria bacterium]